MKKPVICIATAVAVLAAQLSLLRPLMRPQPRQSTSRMKTRLRPLSVASSEPSFFWPQARVALAGQCSKASLRILHRSSFRATRRQPLLRHRHLRQHLFLHHLLHMSRRPRHRLLRLLPVRHRAPRCTRTAELSGTISVARSTAMTPALAATLIATAMARAANAAHASASS